MGSVCIFGPQLTRSWGRYDHKRETSIIHANCPAACGNCILAKWQHGPGNRSCANFDETATLAEKIEGHIVVGNSRNACPEIQKGKSCKEVAFQFEKANPTPLASLAWSVFGFQHIYPDFDVYYDHLRKSYAPTLRQVQNLQSYCPVSCKLCRYPCEVGTVSSDGLNTVGCMPCGSGESPGGIEQSVFQ